jgi:arginine-tRNA-protein transferase
MPELPGDPSAARILPYYARETPDNLRGAELDRYLARGWFRSGQEIFTTDGIWNDDQTVYFPAWWLRFPINEIRKHRSHDKIRKKNAGFRVAYSKSFTQSIDDIVVYFAYSCHIPFLNPGSIEQALYEPPGTDRYDTRTIRVYDGKKPVAIAIFDVGKDAVASILHFYNPGYARFSPGKYLMLLTLDYMRAHGYSLYYPGYVVSRKPMFDYKLFLGKEAAYFYDRPSNDWLPFRDELLHRKVYVPVNE